jgi:hypothetical protein
MRPNSLAAKRDHGARPATADERRARAHRSFSDGLWGGRGVEIRERRYSKFAVTFMHSIQRCDGDPPHPALRATFARKLGKGSAGAF